MLYNIYITYSIISNICTYDLQHLSAVLILQASLISYKLSVIAQKWHVTTKLLLQARSPMGTGAMLLRYGNIINIIYTYSYTAFVH